MYGILVKDLDNLRYHSKPTAEEVVNILTGEFVVLDNGVDLMARVKPDAHPRTLQMLCNRAHAAYATLRVWRWIMLYGEWREWVLPDADM